MSVLTALHGRNSHSKLMEPGPDASQLQAIVQAGSYSNNTVKDYSQADTRYFYDF